MIIIMKLEHIVRSTKRTRFVTVLYRLSSRRGLVFNFSRLNLLAEVFLLQ